MLNRIKQFIIDYHGEKEWFFLCLKGDGWQRYETWLNMVEHRIVLDKIDIDIHELGGGRFRMATGVRRDGGQATSWKAVEFADTGMNDNEWQSKVHALLNTAYNAEGAYN